MNDSTKLGIGAAGALVVLFMFPGLLFWTLAGAFIFGAGWFGKALKGPGRLERMMESGTGDFPKLE